MRDLLEPIGESKANIKDNRRYHDSTLGRQGCILSPSLFNLYSEYLLQEEISKKRGILINSVNINNICYADDTVILVESEEQLQAMFDKYLTTAKSMAWRSTQRRPRRCTLEETQRRLQ
ncbi:hypothetical protein ElyMa_001817000 [Elysia marginata]|uniref:Reverse transcriptase domain-containing protein n=1 Tax=Elysia marginata TaxID=1093978 RepID=A0AAV4EGR0_9GAST|nr:hypothetical protein ElyMa_001817000 [Elysia marginata]